jgi:hypothetical protein
MVPWPQQRLHSTVGAKPADLSVRILERFFQFADCQVEAGAFRGIAARRDRTTTPEEQEAPAADHELIIAGL